MKEGMNMKNDNYIGTIIRNKRNEKGISIRELARLTNISHTTICDLENGNTKTHKIETLMKIANILGIDLNELNKNVKTIYMDVPKDYSISIKKISDNCVSLIANDYDLLIKILENFSFNIDEFELETGDELNLNIKSILSEDEQENYYYCPYCNAELNVGISQTLNLNERRSYERTIIFYTWFNDWRSIRHNCNVLSSNK